MYKQFRCVFCPDELAVRARSKDNSKNSIGKLAERSASRRDLRSCTEKRISKDSSDTELLE